jgi:hypothetical protein
MYKNIWSTTFEKIIHILNSTSRTRLGYHIHIKTEHSLKAEATHVLAVLEDLRLQRIPLALSISVLIK